jgi:hypothetical protein
MKTPNPISLVTAAAALALTASSVLAQPVSYPSGIARAAAQTHNPGQVPEAATAPSTNPALGSAADAAAGLQDASKMVSQAAVAKQEDAYDKAMQKSGMYKSVAPLSNAQGQLIGNLITFPDGKVTIDSFKDQMCYRPFNNVDEMMKSLNLDAVTTSALKRAQMAPPPAPANPPVPTPRPSPNLAKANTGLVETGLGFNMNSLAATGATGGSHTADSAPAPAAAHTNPGATPTPPPASQKSQAQAPAVSQNQGQSQAPAASQNPGQSPAAGRTPPANGNQGQHQDASAPPSNQVAASSDPGGSLGAQLGASGSLFQSGRGGDGSGVSGQLGYGQDDGGRGYGAGDASITEAATQEAVAASAAHTVSHDYSFNAVRRASYANAAQELGKAAQQGDVSVNAAAAAAAAPVPAEVSHGSRLFGEK